MGGRRLLGQLLALLLPAKDREIILGDAEELHAHRCRIHGRPAADRRYLWDVIASVCNRRFRTTHRPAHMDRPDQSIIERMWNSLLADFRHALRQLWKNPGFACVAILTLALGIGSNTAIFSALNAIVLEPLPYPEADRLVVLWTDDVKRQLHETLVSPPLYRDWDAQNRTFAAMGFATRNSPLTWTGIAEPKRLSTSLASASIFSVLGVSPLEGRTFTSDEDKRGEQLALVSERFANRWFGSARAAIGKSLTLNGELTQVIGVMPSEFLFPGPDIDVWLPLGDRAARVVVVGRLRSNATIDRARDDMVSLGKDLANAYPNLAANPDFQGFEVNLVPIRDHIAGKDIRLALWTSLATVLLVLLIAGTNVTGLLVARASAQQRDVAVRLALGAHQGRIVQQFLVEGLTLALLAGTLGLALALGLLRILVTSVPVSLPRLDSVSLDASVLTFSMAVTLTCGVSLGAVAAWNVTRLRIGHTLREAGRSQASGTRRHRLQRNLVVSEIALTLVLLCGAGLLLRSLGEVGRLPLGFQPGSTLVFRVVVPETLDRPQRGEFYRDAVEQLSALPGVNSVGVVSNLFMAYTPNATVRIEDRAEAALETPVVDDVANPEFFAALGVALTRGRFYTTHDIPHVAVITEEFSRRFWPGENPIGRRFQFLDDRFADAWVEVVGVIDDLRRNGLEEAPHPQVFLPFAGSPSRGADILISGDPAVLDLAISVRRTIAAIRPDVPVDGISTLEQRLDRLIARRRLQTMLLSIFAASGVILAALGIFGLMRYVVAQRTREIGVRVALGASTHDILVSVLRESVWLTFLGLVIGLSVALAVSGALRPFLFGITSTDPVTFVLAPLLLVLISALACLEPAWRATRVDPIRALRAE